MSREAKKDRVPIHVRFALYGLFMGFAVSRMGFANFYEAHKMFVFEDLRLFLTFCVGVGISSAGYWSIKHLRNLPDKSFNWGSVVGGVMFGAGWAVTGVCPSVVLIQIGEGQLIAFVTMAGVLLGTWTYTRVRHRLPWNQGTCGF